MPFVNRRTVYLPRVPRDDVSAPPVERVARIQWVHGATLVASRRLVWHPQSQRTPVTERSARILLVHPGVPPGLWRGHIWPLHAGRETPAAPTERAGHIQWVHPATRVSTPRWVWHPQSQRTPVTERAGHILQVRAISRNRLGNVWIPALYRAVVAVIGDPIPLTLHPRLTVLTLDERTGMLTLHPRSTTLTVKDRP